LFRGFEIDAHHEPPQGRMGDFGESGIGEDAPATHMELSPDYVLTGFVIIG
jgi:hypothetical protein